MNERLFEIFFCADTYTQTERFYKDRFLRRGKTNFILGHGGCNKDCVVIVGAVAAYNSYLRKLKSFLYVVYRHMLMIKQSILQGYVFFFNYFVQHFKDLFMLDV